MYCIGYTLVAIEIRQTEAFANWFAELSNKQVRARIDVRIRRLSLGNPGDVEPRGEGVSEMKIHYGPGYRVYFIQNGKELIMLLAGGDKSTQSKDIKTAIEMARNLQEIKK